MTPDRASRAALVGRDVEFAAAVSAVADLAQLLVVGEAGVGKTTLLNELVPTLERDGFTCLRATGTAAMATHPLAAIGHLVGDPGVAIGPALTAWAVESVSALAAGSTAVVIVDDAHLLDPWSLHALAQARAQGGPRLVYAVRTGEQWPEAVAELGRVPGARLDLQRLSQLETSLLAESVLGAALDTPSAIRVQAATDGLPLAVDELLRHARRREALVLRSGLFRWDPGSNVDQHLATLLGLRVNDLDHGQRTIVDALVVVDDLPIEVVAALAPGVDMVELEDQRLVAASVRPGWVTIAHPMLRDAAKGMLGPVRRRELVRTLLMVLEGHPATGDDPQLERQRVVLSVEVGAPIEPQALLAVASWGRAHGLWQPLIAVMERAWIDVPSPTTGLTYGEALYWSRRMIEAESVFAAALDLCQNDEERVPLAIARARTLEIGLGRDDAGSVVRSEVWAAVTDPVLRLDLAAGEAERLLFDGEVGQILAILDASPPPPYAGSLGAARFRLTQTTVAALGLRGRMAATADEYALHVELSVLHAADHPLALSVVEPWWVSSNVLAGNTGAVRSMLHDRYQSALLLDDGLSRPLWALPTAIERWTAGDLVAAEYFAREAMGVPAAVASIRRMATHFLARVLELRGDPAGALATSLETVGDDHVGIVRNWGAGLEALCRTRLDVVSTVSIERADSVLAAALDSYDRGQFVSAAYVLHDLARAGAPGACTPLMQAIDLDTDAPMVRWMAAHVGLLDGGDPAAAIDHAADASAHGCGTIAVQILDDARIAAANRRNARVAAWAARLLDEQRERNAGWPDPGVGNDPMETLGLSAREGEVAAAAAAGMSDNEIASALYISVRTVNAHLRATYRKLGVGGRRELRDVLAGAAADRSS